MTTMRLFDLTERMIHLRSIPVASMLSPSVIKIIASQLCERRFAKGESMMRQGAPIEALQLITEGSAALVRSGVSFGRLAAPQSLGFLGILAKSPGTYDATAESDTTVLELDAETLVELLEDHFEFFYATLRYLCERLLYEVVELPAEMLNSRFDGVDAAIPTDRELNLIERIVWLRNTTAFSNCNVNALATMARSLQEVRFAPGDLVFQPGDRADWSFWVLAGKARCTDEQGRTWLAGPTSVLGGLEGLAQKPRWFTLRAETTLVGFHAPISGFMDLLDDDSILGQSFLARLASDLIGLLERKAREGLSPLDVRRNVTNLGNVPVGA